jgi:ATP-dependent DNA ligase
VRKKPHGDHLFKPGNPGRPGRPKGSADKFTRSGFVPPCLPTKAPQPPTGDAWLHEIKHDGFRVVAKALFSL